MKVFVMALLLSMFRAALHSQDLTIDLKQALERARQYATQIQSASIAAQLAREDRRQAVAAALPTLAALNQFIYTQGNGTASGAFVANDGVHVYNEQAVVHQDLFAIVRRGEIRVARAAEAVARAKADVAARGLNVTVIQDYYAVAVAEHKLRSAELSRKEGDDFLDITQKQEKGGEAAHADVIKALLATKQRERDWQEAQLALDKAKTALAVLIFPTLQQNFKIVDDLADLPALGTLEEMAGRAKQNNADLNAARATVSQAKASVNVARYAYLPSFGLDFFYGIDANQFAATTDHPTPESGRSTLPDYLVASRHNLGYSAQATLNIPLWDWGAVHSKVKQAALRAELSELDLSLTQRQLDASIATAYSEAQASFAQVASLRESSDLAAESLRLTVLRYTAAEATTLEVVDAQSTVALARNAFADGLLRYRVAHAALQQLTGNF
jgi:outer membrane protein TolC